jgi:NAD(P)-dependent dehydrogenase (short-subunit alcohol dehydrogenase family)
MAFDNLNAERGYRKWRAYHQSKLANMLFTNEMQRRYPAGSNGPLALAAHPGYAATNLQTRIPFGSLGNALLAQSASRGAASILHAATAPNLPPATLWGPDGFLQLRGAPTRLRPARRALNDDDAYRLWQISEELTDG